MTGQGGVSSSGKRVWVQTPEGRAQERFCTKPTACEDFPDLQICSQLRICAFASRWRQKRIKIANLQMRNSQLWKSGTPYQGQGLSMCVTPKTISHQNQITNTPPQLYCTISSTCVCRSKPFSRQNQKLTQHNSTTGKKVPPAHAKRVFGEPISLTNY